MPFDPYALCPGGRDKKVRFCCPNMLKELEQVIKLLESDQPSACLSYIETLEKTHPNCACLTTAKLSIYRAENRWQEALPIAEQFYVREPENPAAAAEYALALVITGQPIPAVSTLVDAFERMEADTIHSTLLHGALQVATYLTLGGLITPAIAIGRVLIEIPATSEQANMLLFRATSESDMPILFRDWSFDFDCPSNFPDKEKFDEAAVLVRLMRWKQALAILETLTQHADAWSGIWRNIATIHFWLMDSAKCCEALKSYISHPNTPLEDAVDAEVLRMMHTPDALGDQTQVISIQYTITDADQSLEKLLSSPLFYQVGFSEQAFSPPPRGAFLKLDRPFVESAAELTLENASLEQASVLLFGKETDKEARLLLQPFPADDRETVERDICTLLGDLIQMPGEVVSQGPLSRTRIMTLCRIRYPLDKDPDKLLHKLIDDYYVKSFAEQWLALPLGLLDGKTPADAAKEPQYTIPLLAAIWMIQRWYNEEEHEFGESIRNRLGLPTEGPITVAESAEGDDPLAVLDAYPVWRWHRFEVEKLSTEVLAGGMQIVLGMQELRTASRFAEEILNRPLDSMEFAVRVMAFETLIAYAQERDDIERALLWVERGKSETMTKGVSDAAWYLHEITLRLARQDGQGASEAMAYLITHHRDDPQVMGSLQELFIQLGMFNPDGTPSPAFLQSQARYESQSQSEEQKIWTPDGAAVSGGSAAPSKLWVPE